MLYVICQFHCHNLFVLTMHAHTCTHTHTHTHHRMAGVSTVPSLDGAVAKELNSEADLVSRVQRLRCKAWLMYIQKIMKAYGLLTSVKHAHNDLRCYITWDNPPFPSESEGSFTCATGYSSSYVTYKQLGKLVKLIRNEYVSPLTNVMKVRRWRNI